MYLARVLLVTAGFSVVAAASCDVSRGRRPFRPEFTSSSVGVGGAGAGGEGLSVGSGGNEDCVMDGEGFCGTDVVAIEFDSPNVYFVFDRSGSMSNPAGSGDESLFSVLRGASIDVVDDLGQLINVGLALFPSHSQDGCLAGDEVMEVTPGDKPGQSATTQAFAKALSLQPNGGTPIAATLRNLLPTFEGLPGRTIVMLVTDGGPNCNASAVCAIGDCQANIDGVCPDPNANCCEASNQNFGPRLCVDASATVQALENITAAGVETYVIGIPGTEQYVDVLDAMAVAGGTPQMNAPTAYYRVDDVGAIGSVLRGIAAEAVSCTVPLRGPVTDPMMTNVYFDCDVLPFSDINGWTWEGDGYDTILLHGSFCQALKNGDVGEVQVLTGCPTEVPK